MRQCLNPTCYHPNPEDYQFCHQCGNPLLLRGRYWAKGIIGQGGFGRTFLAVDEDKPSKPFCVIKQFFPENIDPDTLEKAIELVQQEAQQLELLGKHPQIPELLAFFEENHQQYLIQEFIDGVTLKQELAAQGVFSEPQIRSLLVELLVILEFIHGQNVIHRDIKPENIIRRQGDQKLVLVDFGAVKVLNREEGTTTGTKIGSAEFCAPEQAMGKPRLNSDLYSLGLTCLYVLTQQMPSDLYDAVEGELCWRDHLVGNLVSDDLGKVLDKLIETSAKRRYQSASEVLKDLHGLDAVVDSPIDQALAMLLNRKVVDVQPQAVSTPQVSAPPASVSQSKVVAKIDESLPNNKIYHYEIITLNEEGEIAERRKGENYGYLETTAGLNIEMVRIPAGEFIFGLPDNGDVNTYTGGPRYRVTVPEFWMSRTAITQAQWQIVAKMPEVVHDLKPNPAYFSRKNNPVEQVSWEDCIEFCLRLNRASHKPYRLPSEAEWEYACRAGTTTAFYFGLTLSSRWANYHGLANYSSNNNKRKHEEYRNKTTPVGSLNAPNAWGLHDMHGNIWEFCLDDYHQEGIPTDGTAWIDNENHCLNSIDWLKGLLKKNSTSKLRRGGSWCNSMTDCRSANRSACSRDGKYQETGFRVVVAKIL
ncbi:SUMF1/EgtB/PvdO family nonheme iron enzyme [Spirulina sp. CCNP1310]|uniref:bifunctional serine/threonine-protein kinase/formylglycine-generating enzyme family protein n=1 Tax=Spirulina sp. CCNP1310 TaxID=3110249 RepID=UPI002B20C28F|nr:SUMF1/EgtB/PvdO family nonheme iron enzyme [Spirulina sp. CCNP1310]MEA5421253.1 SUMF1/EgtB/PvdO family nonheme iron enzyme [Spirulina sp. CCNP1310]